MPNAQIQEPPNLAFVCELKVQVDQPRVVGAVLGGRRQVVPILGGSISGAGLSGQILPGGSDWQLVRDDGTTELEACYQIKMDDGILIGVRHTGVRVVSPDVLESLRAGEVVPFSDYYFRGTMRFEAPSGRYDWMNATVFVTNGGKLPDHVLIGVWKVG